jgi:hypothetical protein
MFFQMGRVVIGLTGVGLTAWGITPSNVLNGPSLQIYGTSSVLKIKDGSQASGHVLGSDSDGNASWIVPPSQPLPNTQISLGNGSSTISSSSLTWDDSPLNLNCWMW